MRKRIIIIILLLFSLFYSETIVADQVGGDQAGKAAVRWLAKHAARPLETVFIPDIRSIDTYSDDGSDLYHVVNFNPAGFIIVSADDLIEPIIAFAGQGSFSSSSTHPLGALISGDMRQRMIHIKDSKAKERNSVGYHDSIMSIAKSKWDDLLFDSVSHGSETLLSSITQSRVSPLLESTWDQRTAASNYCYNYWTPSHYPCGCVATAMAQLMRYHSWPLDAIGQLTFSITSDGMAQTVQTHGGNNAGGAYIWGSMPLSPNSTTTDAERQQIGYLTADAGYTVNMDYASDGSGADTLDAADALKYPFQYGNAVKAWNSGSNIPSVSYGSMINTNLDAALPVLFGITGIPGGHAVVGDGYGYDASQTIYHHLNLGWGSTSSGLTANVWYNLPNIDTPFMTFNTLYKVVYNVYKTGTGEIISGRVTDVEGNPLSGVTVTGSVSGGGTFTYVTGTNSKLDPGIYALTSIPPNASVTLTAVKAGYQFLSRTVTTGHSMDYDAIAGNVWDANFQSQSTHNVPLVYATFAGSGLYKHNGTSWSRLHAAIPEAMVSSDTALYAAFTGSGLYKHNGTSWARLHAAIPEAMVSSDTTLYAAFTGSGLYKHNGTSWARLHPTVPESMMVSGTTLYATFTGSGLYKHNGTSWSRLHSTVPESMMVSGTTLYAAFTGSGLYKHNGTSWSRLHSTVPESMVVSGTTLYAAFTGSGLYKHNGTSWSRLRTIVPESMVVSGTTLYTTFTGSGLHKYDGITWTQVNIDIPESMVVSGATLYATFAGSGLYKYDGITWTRLNTVVPENIIAGLE